MSLPVHGKHDIPIRIDNKLFALDGSLRELNGSKEIAYHVTSRQDKFFDLHKRSRQFISLCMVVLHFHLTNSMDKLPTILSEMIEEMKRLGIMDDETYAKLVEEIMMME